MPFNIFRSKLSDHLNKVQNWFIGKNILFGPCTLFDTLFVPTILDAKFDLVSEGEEKKLIPVVFSHGITSHYANYSSY